MRRVPRGMVLLVLLDPGGGAGRAAGGGLQRRGGRTRKLGVKLNTLQKAIRARRIPRGG